MICLGVWIKAISYLLFALLLVITGVVAFKKLKWKKTEVGIVFLFSVAFLIASCINVLYAIRPDYDLVKVKYTYHNSKGVIFGREYHFLDEEGNVYDLLMDPITEGHVMGNNTFKKNKTYYIEYEKQSRIITNINENKE